MEAKDGVVKRLERAEESAF